MNLKELMKEYLQEEGFKVTEEEYGLDFRYHGANFVYFNLEGDESFLQVSMPYLYKVDEENRIQALEVCNKLTCDRKVVKIVLIDDEVWINFEVLVDTTPELGDIMPRALNMLSQAREQFYSEMEKALKDGKDQ